MCSSDLFFATNLMATLGFTVVAPMVLARTGNDSLILGTVHSAGAVGGVLGGTLVARVGILKAMLICGVLQGGSNLMYVVQAMVGHSVPMLSLTIAIENLTGGMGTAAFVAYLSSLCNIAYTATQYALLSSLTQFARPFLSAWAGVMVEQLGWIEFFLVSTVAAVPGLVLLILLIRRFPIAEPAQGQPALAGVDD